MKIYLASPLGFSPENDPYRKKVHQRLQSLGCSILDPWEQGQFREQIERAFEAESYATRADMFRDISCQIGRCNENLIHSADMVFAILDGAEIDSGTASEIGFGSALGKKCHGLRTDIRNTGDFLGIPVNLQILHFIERTGGRLFRKVEEITDL